MPFSLLPLSYAFCRWSYALTSCALDVHEVDGNDRHLTTIEGYYHRGQRHVMKQDAMLKEMRVSRPPNTWRVLVRYIFLVSPSCFHLIELSKYGRK